ncbi:MAG: gliding motility-associated C-terminal domain-containing protein [Bacteroidales bacterium]
MFKFYKIPKSLFAAIALLAFSHAGIAQITAPTASEQFSTDYSSDYINSGEENDNVYIFCADQSADDVGELEVENASGCNVDWYRFDGVSYQEIEQSGTTATGLTSGGYMAQVDCGGVITCYRAWVWVNQTFVDMDPIEPSCEEFTLNGQVDAMDTEFEIVDPPGLNFEVDENTQITVCFWADHVYVSDLGFYLKAPGHELDEPAYPPNDDGSHEVVELLPPVSDWGPAAEYGSWTGIPFSVLGCTDDGDENQNCQSGNDVNNFCFSSTLDAGTPSLTPCVCDMPTPLSGTFASAGPWDAIYGHMAGDDGWNVQVYDCEEYDYGTLNRALISFTGETECGTTTFTYDSGDISGLPSSEISDASCSAATASYFVVPPENPPGAYTVTSSLTSYNWTSDGSTFTSTELNPTITPGTSDYPDESANFYLHATETIDVSGSPTCEQTVSEEFITTPSDATITPVAPMCYDDTPVTIEVADPGGTFSVGTGTPEDALEDGVFDPETAGPGTHTIYYEITGACPDSDQIDIVVYEIITVENFSDNVCDGADENFTVSFEVENQNGNPTEYQVNDGSGFTTYTGTYSQQFASPGNYNLTVTDMNGCSEIILEGYTDCGCSTYAGTMASMEQVSLCEGECTDGLVAHNGNENLDSNDVFEYILHDGSEYPATGTSIISRGFTTNFCFIDGAMDYGETYYISAIAGNEEGTTGQVVSDPTDDPCYSQSSGTPVKWYENPTANIPESNISTCGLSVDLVAAQPTSGTGTWSADVSFSAGQGTTVNDHEMTALVGDYGNATFTWDVDNNGCTASDDINVFFAQTPSPFAGNDTTVCGDQLDLNASLSLTGSNGEWSSGAGITFIPESSPTATANLTGDTYGTHILTWTETISGCEGSDNVAVTFIEEPQPSAINNNDTVCGITSTLEVDNVIGEGIWSAYEDGTQIYPTYADGNTSPVTEVTIGSYSGNYRTVDFVWDEENSQGGVTCSNNTTLTVTFAEEPFASVGETDFDETCGSQYTFDADTTNYGWANGSWSAPNAVITWSPSRYNPDATANISPGAFGDSAHVEIDFIWRMSSGGCSDLDTITVAFYKNPTANAGDNNSVCGLEYPLEAFYSLSETANYTPDGKWNALDDNPSTANFNNNEDAATTVNVNSPGIYGFVWRENNDYRSQCNDRDTVWIEFKEKPVISAGEDFDVCGKTACLEAVSAGFDGSWSSSEAGTSYEDTNDPTTCITYNAGYGTIEYVWQEANEECTSVDTVEVTFWRKPTAELAMDMEDTAVCGKIFDNLRAENPGSGVDGNWISSPSNGVEFLTQSYNETVEVANYGYYDFQWVESNHPDNEPPEFCSDSTDPWTVHFIEVPEADAGPDSIYCGLEGELQAELSVETSTGEWDSQSSNITIDPNSDPNATVISQVYTETASSPYDFFELVWTENNFGCTNSDAVEVRFARIPSSDMAIIPPRCFGEAASIKADEDQHPEYDWELNNGIVDSIWPPNSEGGEYRRLVRWPDGDTAHIIGLEIVSEHGCRSSQGIDTIFEPGVPGFDTEVFPDTCLLGKGAVKLIPDSLDTAFEWVDTTGTGITNVNDTVQYNLPANEYRIAHVYRTMNTGYIPFYEDVFGSENCRDTFNVQIDTVGMIVADFEVAPDVDVNSLVAPEAEVWFNNLSDEDELRTTNVWHFDDGESETNNDEQVEHIYTEPRDCYQPYLVVYARNLPQCRDTAYMDCIKVDDRSSLEVPNIFTPNGDGQNDFFQVEAKTLETFQGKVVNRWGNSIYEWENYQDEEAGWDGKLPGGSDASQGVYFYIITATGIDGYEYELTGPFHLTR